MRSPLLLRLGYFAISLACAGMIAFALYLQYYQFLNPCPMCIFQRVFIMLTGVVALIAAIGVRPARTGSASFWSRAIIVPALLGMCISIRHTWIQLRPPEGMTTCDAGLMFMLEKQPFFSVVRDVLYGTGDCTKIDWTFLGIALPGWGIVGFGGMAVWAWWVGRKFGSR
ncbi:disulfide bond formation protein B [Burkholderiaceae bacterium DAT-1]|nr:disulfide bond formation protein B [Burkholderiaceae bacterium DAT-1]